MCIFLIVWGRKCPCFLPTHNYKMCNGEGLGPRLHLWHMCVKKLIDSGTSSSHTWLYRSVNSGVHNSWFLYHQALGPYMRAWSHIRSHILDHVTFSLICTKVEELLPSLTSSKSFWWSAFATSDLTSFPTPSSAMDNAQQKWDDCYDNSLLLFQLHTLLVTESDVSDSSLN